MVDRKIEDVVNEMSHLIVNLNDRVTALEQSFIQQLGVKRAEPTDEEIVNMMEIAGVPWEEARVMVMRKNNE